MRKKGESFCRTQCKTAFFRRSSVEVGAIRDEANATACRESGRPHRKLRPLLFQYDLGLFGRYLFLFLPVGARNVAERRGLRCGTELPQRTLPLGIRVSIG